MTLLDTEISADLFEVEVVEQDDFVAVADGEDISVTVLTEETIVVTVASQGPPGTGGVQSIEPGTNVTVDDSDPAHPIVSASGGGGSGLPSQWSEGGNGDVVATTDDATKTAIAIEATAAQVAALLSLKDENAAEVFAFVASLAQTLLSIKAAAGQAAADLLIDVRDENGNPLLQLNQETGGIGSTFALGPTPVYNAGLFLQLDEQVGVFGESFLRLTGTGQISLDNYTDINFPANSQAQVTISAAGSQTEPLIRFRDSSNVVVARVFPSGAIEATESVTVSAVTGQTDPLLDLKDESAASVFTFFQNGSGLSPLGFLVANVPASAQPGWVPEDAQDGSEGWVTVGLDEQGTIQAGYGADGSNYAALIANADGSLFQCELGGRGIIGQALANGTSLTIRAQVGQTEDVFHFFNPDGVVSMRLAPYGQFVTSGAIGTSSGEPADADINPGECFRYFDPTPGAAGFVMKGKDTDGNVVKTFGPMAAV